jgi:hypothetical protein
MTEAQDVWVLDPEGRTETLQRDDLRIGRCLCCNGFLLTASVSDADVDEVFGRIRSLVEWSLQKGRFNITVEAEHHKPYKSIRRKRTK